MPGLIGLTAACLSALSCRSENRVERLLAHSLLDASLEGVTFLSPPKATRLRRVHTLALPESVSAFTLDRPITVAVGRSPSERVLILDGQDRAIHVFDDAFGYRRTIFGGGREPSLFPNPISLAISDSGVVVVSDVGWGRLVVYPSLSNSPVLHSPPRWDELGARDLAFAGDGRLLEHWFPLRVAYRSASWGDTLPLVRSWRVLADGSLSLDHWIGAIAPMPGMTFTAALNRGLIQVWRDTLWFARRWDASILGFSIPDHRTVPDRVVRVPQFFRMLRPKEIWYRGVDLWQVLVEDHLTAFCVDRDGAFLIGQAVRYPRLPNQFSPTTLLTVLDRTEGLRYFDLGGAILGLAASDQYLFAIVRRQDEDTGLMRRVVDVFQLP